MIDAFLHLFRFHKPSHFWRDVKMSELSELYLSMSLKTMALSLVGIFIPIYLYELNYPISDIIWFFLLLYAFRLPMQIVFGYLTAWRGPKHVMKYSYVLLMLLMVMLYTLPDSEWPLWSIALVMGTHLAAFFTGYHVDFSKIKSIDSAGSQLSNMMIYVKVAAGAGPLVGGVVASVFGIEWTIAAAALVLAAAVIPLMGPGEPVKKNQVIRWQGVFGPRLRRAIFSNMGTGLDQSSAVLVWPLIMGAFIFTENVYASVGAVTTINFVISILVSRYIGRASDKHGGRTILNYSAGLLAITHVGRLFVGNTAGVVVSNASNEVGMIGTRVPYIKGYYGLLDELKGQRIVGVMVMEVANSFMRLLQFGTILILIPVLGDERAVYSGLIFGALGALMMTTQNFKVIK